MPYAPVQRESDARSGGASTISVHCVAGAATATAGTRSTYHSARSSEAYEIEILDDGVVARDAVLRISPASALRERPTRLADFGAANTALDLRILPDQRRYRPRLPAARPDAHRLTPIG